MARKIKNKTKGRSIQPTILIVTTGTKTEKIYLERIKQEHHRSADIPIQITIKTSQKCAEATVVKFMKNLRDNEYDEVWFIVDKDNDDLANFISQCKEHSAMGVVSSPCFEVWLIAHYEQVKNYQTPKEAQIRYKKLAKLETKNEKDIPEDFPWDQISKACSRCQLKGISPAAINTIPKPPSSAMPHLIKRLGLNKS